jgi:hypothetical protein
MPAITDCLAHTFWKMNHVATVHYENGKYHLHAELEKAADESETKNKAPKALSSETVFQHIKSEILLLNIYQTTEHTINSAYVIDYAEVFIENTNPPPRA